MLSFNFLPSIKILITDLQHVVEREWERDVSNARHSGTLGHGHYSRDWLIVEVDVKIYIVQLKTYWNGKRLLCYELPYLLS